MTIQEKIINLRAILKEVNRDIAGMMHGPLTLRNKCELEYAIQFRAFKEAELTNLLAKL